MFDFVEVALTPGGRLLPVLCVGSVQREGGHTHTERADVVELQDAEQQQQSQPFIQQSIRYTISICSALLLFRCTTISFGVYSFEYAVNLETLLGNCVECKYILLRPISK